MKQIPSPYKPIIFPPLTKKSGTIRSWWRNPTYGLGTVRRGIILEEANPMSGVFRNVDPPPPHPLASVYPPPLVRGEDTLAGWRRGGGSIVRKTLDTALYSMYIQYVSTLWYGLLDCPPLDIYPGISGG
jgi:hypothetical protein